MRKQISTRQRFEIFKRDLFTCQYCGSHPPSVILHVDHIVPVSKNGGNEKENLITSCSKCNLGKSNIELNNIPESFILKSEIIKEKEKQLKAYYKLMETIRIRQDSEVFSVAKILNEKYERQLSRVYYTSIKNFISKIGYYEVLEAMEIAVSKSMYEKHQFKYFCGICWNKIKK